MEWEHLFPELIPDFAEINDTDAITAYVAAVEAAGAERIAAEDANDGTLSDDDLDELTSFQASLVAAAARLEALEAAKAARKAKVATLGFARPSAPPPALPAPPPASEPKAEEVEVVSTFAVQPSMVTAVAAGRWTAGQQIRTLDEQAEVMFARAKALTRANSGERFNVLTVTDYVPAELHLPDDGAQMYRLLRDDAFDADGLVAGFCAPPTVDYSFCGMSSALRPVLGGMRRYQAPRGRVTKVNTGRFSDIGTSPGDVDTTGIGQWTDSDDDAEPFVPKTCSIVTCPGDEDFEVYGTYKCVTVKNFMQAAFPELVAWSLGMLDAHWARYAEVLLLDQIIARAGAAITTEGTYGAYLTFITRLNQAMTRYIENERYATAGLKAFLPRWVFSQLYDDVFRRSGGTVRLTRGTVEADLASIGITQVVWTMDNPTAYDDIDQQAKGTPLEDYPSTAWIVISRADNLRLMDLGVQNLGITTEREYRDTSTNLNNDFQIFVETFEGVIDMGCPTWLIELPLCDNGLSAPTSGYGAKPCGSADETNDVAATG